MRQNQKKQGVDGLISLFLCGVQVQVSGSFARLEAKLREGTRFGDGRDGLPGRWRWVIGRGRGYWQLPGSSSLLERTGREAVMEGGSGSRAAHRIVMAGEWHLAVTWASRKAFASGLKGKPRAN